MSHNFMINPKDMPIPLKIVDIQNICVKNDNIQNIWIMPNILSIITILLCAFIISKYLNKKK